MVPRDERGSVTEFAVLIPLVISTMLVALQLLLIITQRSESHAIADRIAFLAAATGELAARQEASLQQDLNLQISQIRIDDLGKQYQVKVISSLELVIPIITLNYEVIAVSQREP